jgi:hypothetical protein
MGCLQDQEGLRPKGPAEEVVPRELSGARCGETINQPAKEEVTSLVSPLVDGSTGAVYTSSMFTSCQVSCVS